MSTGVAVTALTDAITAAKMNLKLESVVNADVEAGAAIAYSKLATLASARLIVGSAGGVATAVDVTGDVTISNAGVTAIAGLAIVNADISATAAIVLSNLEALAAARLIVGSAGTVPTAVDVTGDVTISNTGVTAIASGVIINTDVKSDAAIAWSKLATLASAHILVGSAGNVATDVEVTGDITISNAGVTAITALAIENADIAAAAAIAWSKMAALTSAHILVGSAANVATDVAVTGDVTISNAGVTAIGATKVTEAMLAASSGSGLGVLRVARAKYSFAVDGGVVGLITPATNATIPDNAIIIGGQINSTTAVTSADAATISIGTSAGSSATSLLGVTGKASFGADAVQNSAATFAAAVKMSAAGSITLTIADFNLTAGIIEVTVLYFVAQA